MSKKTFQTDSANNLTADGTGSTTGSSLLQASGDGGSKTSTPNDWPDPQTQPPPPPLK